MKRNSVILINAGSLVGTTLITSGLGFAYWLVAARQFSPEIVGLASAAISAMLLLGNVCILGLGTLLIGELPRQPGKEASLISGALILVGGLGGGVGILFAVVSPAISTDFQALRASVQDIALFAAGVALTAITLVLDQALIGLLRGEWQFWRNTLFAVTKLAALFAVGLWLSHVAGLTIYATWTAGNALSLAVLAGFVVLREGWSGRSYLPEWVLLRKLKSAALQHHILNLMLQVPPFALPVLTTVMLSARMNAWFYISYTVAAFVYFLTVALATVLYATSSAQPATLAHKARLTLGLSFVACLLANVVLLLGARQILDLFGHAYAEQASWSLRILGLAAFPVIIKNHYIAVYRVQRRLAQAMLPIAAGTFLEVGAPALGAYLGGLSGLSLGLIGALCVEAMYMSRTVFKAVRFIDTSTQITIRRRHIETEAELGRKFT